MARIDKVKIPEIQKIGIYAIHNKENEKYYIGSSVNVFKRMKQQKSAIKNYGLNSKILKDMFSKNFDVEFLILETFEDDTITDEQLRKSEWEYIQKYDSIKAGYNTSVPFPTGKYKGLLKCNVVKKTGKNRSSKKQNEKIKENYDRISVTLPKGTKQQIINKGETVNGLINKLVKDWLESQ